MKLSIAVKTHHQWQLLISNLWTRLSFPRQPAALAAVATVRCFAATFVTSCLRLKMHVPSIRWFTWIARHRWIVRSAENSFDIAPTCQHTWSYTVVWNHTSVISVCDVSLRKSTFKDICISMTVAVHSLAACVKNRSHRKPTYSGTFYRILSTAKKKFSKLSMKSLTNQKWTTPSTRVWVKPWVSSWLIGNRWCPAVWRRHRLSWHPCRLSLACRRSRRK